MSAEVRGFSHKLSPNVQNSFCRLMTVGSGSTPSGTGTADAWMTDWTVTSTRRGDHTLPALDHLLCAVVSIMRQRNGRETRSTTIQSRVGDSTYRCRLVNRYTIRTFPPRDIKQCLGSCRVIAVG